MGAYGAALATMLGYAAVLAMRHIILRKHVRMHIKWSRDIAAYMLLVVQMVVSAAGLKFIVIQALFFVTIVVLFKNEVASFLKNAKNSVTKRL